MCIGVYSNLWRHSHWYIKLSDTSADTTLSFDRISKHERQHESSVVLKLSKVNENRLQNRACFWWLTVFKVSGTDILGSTQKKKKKSITSLSRQWTKKEMHLHVFFLNFWVCQPAAGVYFSEDSGINAYWSWRVLFKVPSVVYFEVSVHSLNVPAL